MISANKSELSENTNKRVEKLNNFFALFSLKNRKMCYNRER